MNINRHNYENYFLLYVDKELPAADKKAVEVFVAANPDLKIELELLQQTVFRPDAVVLDKKDWLYMEAEPSQLQENLLLYADGELIEADRNSVKELINTDEAAGKEWDILKQTILQPDLSVLHPDKRSLYKNEDATIVAIRWWRVAAAAVFLGVGLWAGLAVYNNGGADTGNNNELVGNNTKTENPDPGLTATSDPANKTAVVVEAADDPGAGIAVTQQSISKTGAGDPVADAVVPVQRKNTRKEADQQNAVAAVDKKTDTKKQDNNLPESYLDKINNKAGNESVASTVIPENKHGQVVSGNNTARLKSNPGDNIVSDFTSEANPTAVALNTLNKNTGIESNSRYVNLEEDDNKRTALGGFLRKAKRVLERTTNLNAGEGDGIKIAGFEIALK